MFFLNGIYKLNNIRNENKIIPKLILKVPLVIITLNYLINKIVFKNH